MASKNFPISAVATAPSPATSGTSLVVTSGHGARFPSVPFKAVIWPTASNPDPSNAEIVTVTNVSTDTLTITRAQESSTARTVVVGDQIAAVLTAAMWDLLNSRITDLIRQYPVFFNDFFRIDQSLTGEWFGSAIGTGGTLIASTRQTTNHPGVAILKSGSANSGYFVGTRHTTSSSSPVLPLSGLEVSEFVFNIDTLTNATLRIGFGGTNNTSDWTDGCYLEISSAGVGTGKTAASSSRSSTGTTYTLSTNTWYRLVISVNSNASTITFALYNDSGTQLWTNTLSTNIPTAAVGICVNAWESGGGSQNLLHMDFMALYFGRTLTR